MTDLNTPMARMDLLAMARDELRERKRALDQQVKEIERELEANEHEIIELADAIGLKKFAVGKLSFSISENVVGNVEDWDQVYGYIKQHDAFHLVQRRLANAAYKEILDNGEQLPGVEPFVKRSLNMRKAS